MNLSIEDVQNILKNYINLHFLIFNTIFIVLVNYHNSDVKDLLDKVRAKLATRGTRGFIGIQR